LAQGYSVIFYPIISTDADERVMGSRHPLHVGRVVCTMGAPVSNNYSGLQVGKNAPQKFS
jgi:hypothetical protein